MRIKLIALALACLTAVATLSGCSGGRKVVIGSKNFTENEILAEMMAQLIEKNSDIQVTRKLDMGGTLVCFAAIQKGQIDLYPEYTGTGLMEELKLPVSSDSEKVYQTVKTQFESKFHITWLKQLGFNNTYALAIPQSLMQKNHLETISDLSLYASQYTFGAEQEFFNRADGYDGLIKAYGLKFGKVSKMDVSLKYQAVGSGKIQVTDAFTTDGQLKALNLKVLKDDRGYFPPYYAAPIVRDATLKKYPKLETLLNKLGGQIDDETMQQLNYLADHEKKPIQQVAANFLKQKGLIS